MLRQGTTEDIPVLVELMDEFYAESHFELDRTEATSTFKTLVDHPDFGTVWIFEGDTQAAGYVVLTVRFSMEFGGLVGSIDDLYVRPSERRKGIGNELLHSLLIDCHDRGLEGLDVEVAPDNLAAQALYRRIGLQVRGDERVHMTTKLKDLF